MEMNNKYIPYELCGKLRELGYSPQTSEFISEDTVYDVIDWLEEHHRIYIMIKPYRTCPDSKIEYASGVCFDDGISVSSRYITKAFQCSHKYVAIKRAIEYVLNYLNEEKENE